MLILYYYTSETDPSANKLNVHIKQFQKRLAVAAIVYVEFIAKAKMWIFQQPYEMVWRSVAVCQAVHVTMNSYIVPYSSGVQVPLPDRLRYE